MKQRKEFKAWTWEVPAVITKADITPTGALKGRVNALSLTVGDATRPARSVVFCGFAGARAPDGKYHGVYRFAPADPKAEYQTFTTLPNVMTESPCGQESEDSNVDDCNGN